MPEALRDRFDRRLDYLRLSVTDRCNLSCVYCSPRRPGGFFQRQQMLTRQEILRLVGVLARHHLGKVRITGGEPLLREDLVEIVAGLRELGIPDISLTSNGTLLAGAVGRLRRAGLRRVNVSLDTLNPERYRGITRGGDIGRVWEAIAAARAEGLVPVKINVVPVRGLNDDEILDFARLTLQNDFHIRFIELMPSVGCPLKAGESYVPSARVLELVSQLGVLESLDSDRRGPAHNFRLPGAAGVIGVISPYGGHFCRWCNRLRLGADGSMRPCLFSQDTVDFRPALRSGAGDEELEALLAQAVAMKPRCNRLGSEDAGAIASMSSIGG